MMNQDSAPGVQTMQAVVLRETGGPGQFRVETVSRPEPGPGEVCVRLAAAAFNHRDLWISKGQYAQIRLPVVPGSDGVGVVDARGPGAEAPPPGQRVLIDPSLGWGPDSRFQDAATYSILGMPQNGTFAEYVVVPAAQLHACPPHLTDAEAAALPLAGLTAWRAVVTRGGLARDERVLVTGIGGGVASMALRWAHSLGARVWVTSSDPAKLAAARAQGAEGGVDYRREDWPATLREQAGGDFDLIVDGAGGPGFGELVGLAGYGARIVHYGATRGNPAGFDLRRVFWRQIDIRGTTMGHGGEFAAMLAHVAALGLRPQVDRVFPLADAAAAAAYLEAGGQMGKVVLEMAAVAAR